MPLDGSALSAAVLPLARRLARAGRAEIILLQVRDPDRGWPEAEARLRRIAAELGAGELSVWADVLTGDPAAQILATAAVEGADLIVMAALGRSGVSRRILASSPVPVLLAHPGHARPARLERLLVPVDGTLGGAAGLAPAARLAHALGARLVLARIVAPPAEPTHAGADRPTEGFGAQPDPQALAAAQVYVDRVALRLRRTGLEVEAVVRVGTAAGGILALADDVNADMIVMSTHGSQGLARMLVRSVAADVVHAATQPVLVVRRLPRTWRGEAPTADYAALHS